MNHEVQILQPSWNETGTIPKCDTKALTESLKLNIFIIHFSMSCHLCTDYLWPGSRLPKCYIKPPRLQEKSRGGFSHGRPTGKRHDRGRCAPVEAARARPGPFPRQIPSPWGCAPLPCTPVRSRVGPGQSLRREALRALRGAARPYVCAAISAEASNSCIVSDHLSTTTPCQYAERNAETSTVPLDTHLFFRVNFPELLCKLLACRMSSRGLCFVCVL